jgi:hypothetical protein
MVMIMMMLIIIIIGYECIWETGGISWRGKERIGAEGGRTL